MALLLRTGFCDIGKTDPLTYRNCSWHWVQHWSWEKGITGLQQAATEGLTWQKRCIIQQDGVQQEAQDMFSETFVDLQLVFWFLKNWQLSNQYGFAFLTQILWFFRLFKMLAPAIVGWELHRNCLIFFMIIMIASSMNHQALGLEKSKKKCYPSWVPVRCPARGLDRRLLGARDLHSTRSGSLPKQEHVQGDFDHDPRNSNAILHKGNTGTQFDKWIGLQKKFKFQ